MSPSLPSFRRLISAWSRLATFRDVEVVVYRLEHVTTPATVAEIRRVDARNVGDASAMEPPERVEEFRRFLERGDVGWYAYVDGRMVHRSWVRRGPLVVPLWLAWGRLVLGPGDDYIHYCETVATARGMGIYPAVLATAAAAARHAGAHAVLISTDLGNHASRRGIEKAGFVESGRYAIQVRFGVGTQRETRLVAAPAPSAP